MLSIQADAVVGIPFGLARQGRASLPCKATNELRMVENLRGQLGWRSDNMSSLPIETAWSRMDGEVRVVTNGTISRIFLHFRCQPIEQQSGC